MLCDSFFQTIVLLHAKGLLTKHVVETQKCAEINWTPSWTMRARKGLRESVLNFLETQMYSDFFLSATTFPGRKQEDDHMNVHCNSSEYSQNGILAKPLMHKCVCVWMHHAISYKGIFALRIPKCSCN